VIQQQDPVRPGGDVRRVRDQDYGLVQLTDGVT